jgi:ribose 5-phosphate isomerase B
MRIAVAADHAGFPLKAPIIEVLRSLGHDVTDLGTDSTEAVDYPDFAVVLAREVGSGRVERGIVLCGSGVGASVVANKVRGVRAAVCHDTYSAHQGVEHDDMNVLAIGARVIGVEPAKEIAAAFADAAFSGDERHVRRLKKLLAIEAESMDQKEATNA